MRPIKQGWTIKAAVEFQFKNPLTNRLVTVKQGSEWVVTNNTMDQEKTGCCKIDRKKSAKLGLGHYFNWDMMVQFFSVNNLPPSYFAS